MIWNGQYKKRWRKEILKYGMKHPAKYAPILVETIYSHARGRGWISNGSTVLDPFAGVATGAYSAIMGGLNWTGIELNEKFAADGQANIVNWSGVGSGKARVITGSSINMAELLGDMYGKFDIIVSSPPYASVRIGKTSNQDQVGHKENYSSHAHQLGSMDDYKFWTLAESILASCYNALKPHGVAVWVVKAYNRDNGIVDFPQAWRNACITAGFVHVETAKAMQVEKDENGKEKSYKGYWRRYNEKVRGLPAVDFEEVQFTKRGF